MVCVAGKAFVVAILDSGSGTTTMCAGIAHKLQAAFPDVQVVGGMTHPWKLKVADGRVLAVQEETCPVRIALHTSWRLVTMDPFSFVVMPGDDDVVILGNPTLKLVGIDAYDSLGPGLQRDPHRACFFLDREHTAIYCLELPRVRHAPTTCTPGNAACSLRTIPADMVVIPDPESSMATFVDFFNRVI